MLTSTQLNSVIEIHMTNECNFQTLSTCGFGEIKGVVVTSHHIDVEAYHIIACTQACMFHINDATKQTVYRVTSLEV